MTCTHIGCPNEHVFDAITDYMSKIRSDVWIRNATRYIKGNLTALEDTVDHRCSLERFFARDFEIELAQMLGPLQFRF